jgi:hypothetical protein
VGGVGYIVYRHLALAATLGSKSEMAVCVSKSSDLRLADKELLGAVNELERAFGIYTTASEIIKKLQRIVSSAVSAGSKAGSECGGDEEDPLRRLRIGSRPSKQHRRMS